MRFEDAKAGYKNLYDRMVILPSKQATAESVARKIIANRARYENLCGVPWWFIGILHYRESGLRFDRYLGNGTPLNRVTTAVPAGRGPFVTFEAGVIDALTIQGYANQEDWSQERVLYRFEAFNGFGYIQHKINSPYVWAGSNLYTIGKYSSDGIYTSSLVDQQLGCAVIFNILMRLINMTTEQPVTSTAPEIPVPVNAVTTDMNQVFVQHLLTFIGATLVAVGATHAASVYDMIVNSQVLGGVVVAAAGYLLNIVGVNDSNKNTRALLDSIVVKLTTLAK
jgi:lysozyme family protein